MKLSNYRLIICLICFCSGNLISQVDSIAILETISDTIQAIDTTQLQSETLLDTIPTRSTTDERISFAEDGMDAPIKYGALDTQWYDHKAKIMHLYGEAYVEYRDMTLNAGYIAFDMENNVATAMFIKNEAGDTIQLPQFNDGDREFTYDKLKYNFKEEKGIVYDAITTEGDLFIHGRTTKYVSGTSDSLSNDKIVYNKNALITTCEHTEPHYGIRSKKMKVVTDKVAVVGPSNLELAGVPTPIWIPFGFFPLTDGESSGLIFPQDFHYSQQKGFGLEGVGWYFPLNDYMNLIVKGDIFTNGSHGINLTSQYRKKYGFNGNINLGYYNERFESPDLAFLSGERESIFTSQKSFFINISHNQDSKAHPYRKLGGNVNIQTNNYASRVRNDASSVLTNIYRSNFSFSHSMPRTPFTFSSSFRHQQNTQTGSISFTFPDIQLRMSTIYPFKKKNSSGTSEKWYEKISFKYDNEVKNFLETSDSTIFNTNLLKEMRSGVSHSARSDVNVRFLKYFNFVPSVTYNEDWVFKSLSKDYIGVDTTLLVDTTYFLDATTSLDTLTERDTTLFFVEDEYNRGFKAYRNYDVTASINTQLFATIASSKGWFRGWRQTIKPKVDLSYSPSTVDKYELMLRTGQDEEDLLRYSPFQQSAISVPSLSIEQFRIGYGVTGVMEMKHFSKKDSIEKKIKLFDNLFARGNYNFAADSLKYSAVTTGGTSRWFNGMTTFTFGFKFDPYEEGETGRYDLLVSERKKIPFRLDDGFLKLSTRVSVKDVIKLLSKKKDEEESKERKESPDKDLWSITKWIENIRIEHDIQYNFETQKGIDTSFLNIHTLRFSGVVPITENWELRVGNITYDFKNDRLIYPSFAFSRKLHCWNMNFSWHPERDVYSFFIGVSSNTLNFLKYNYGQQRIDGLQSPFLK